MSRRLVDLLPIASQLKFVLAHLPTKTQFITSGFRGIAAMRLVDLITAGLLLTIAGWVGAAPPEPIFEDDEDAAWADEELRSSIKAPRPIFADEPFFEDDVYPPELPKPIVPVECRSDSVHIDHDETPWWHSLRPLSAWQQDDANCDPDNWPWPDRGRSWTARILAARWSRSSDGGPLFSNPTVPGEVFSAGAFDVSHDGADLSLMLHDFWPNGAGKEYDLELRFIYLLEGTASANSTLSGPDTLVHTLPPVLQAGDFNVSSTLTSTFYTGEVNVRYEHEIGWWTSMWGLRYVSLDDDLAVTLTDPGGGGSSNYLASSSNRMWGPQVGGNLAFIRTRRFCVDLTGKVGALWNSADAASSYTGTGAFNTSDSSTHIAFMGEFGVNGRYAFGKHWTFVLGYQALWLNRVAEAGAQLSHVSSLTGNGSEFGSDVVYHAGEFGFEYRY